jgi:glycosyltransferase involved in cell wall biosynthesis
LHALVNQSTQQFDILVMVDGSEDNTVAIVNDFRIQFDLLRIKVIWQQNQGRARVKNNGASIVGSGLLIFFDDDTEPDRNAVQRHIEFHNQYSGILAGNVVEYPSAQKTDVANYKAMLTHRWTDKYPKDILRLGVDNLFFSAANCSIPKTIFDQLGGFNSALHDAEDFDLALRALENGIAVYYDKMNTVVHHENLSCAAYIKRLRQYGRAHAQLAELHPERKHQRQPTSRPRKVIYRFFSFPFWLWLIDNGIFVFLIPRKLRYHLYSVVIHALSVEYANIKI